MARKKEVESHGLLQNGNLRSLLVALGAAGTISVGGMSYSKSSGADERTAKLETKVEKLEEGSKDTAKKVEKIDQRTIRINEQLKAISNKMGVRVRDREEE